MEPCHPLSNLFSLDELLPEQLISCMCSHCTMTQRERILGSCEHRTPNMDVQVNAWLGPESFRCNLNG